MREINRRGVVKGAAWTAPVILAAGAAPAFAASAVETTPPVDPTPVPALSLALSGTANGNVGVSEAYATFTVTNTGAVDAPAGSVVTWRGPVQNPGLWDGNPCGLHYQTRGGDWPAGSTVVPSDRSRTSTWPANLDGALPTGTPSGFNGTLTITLPALAVGASVTLGAGYYGGYNGAPLANPVRQPSNAGLSLEITSVAGGGAVDGNRKYSIPNVFVPNAVVYSTVVGSN